MEVSRRLLRRMEARLIPELLGEHEPMRQRFIYCLHVVRKLVQPSNPSAGG